MGDMPGGQFVIPREIIKATCDRFVDMPADTIGERTFCCGGGGGLLTDDLMEPAREGRHAAHDGPERRRRGAGRDAHGRDLRDLQGQFTKVLPYYGFEMDQLMSLHSAGVERDRADAPHRRRGRRGSGRRGRRGLNRTGRYRLI